MAHIHSVFDSNEHFVIDPVTRNIASSLAKKIMVMQFDHNSERFTFEIPKVDGHNMANCDRVEIHYINVDAVDKSLKSTGVYEVNDIQNSHDDNSVAVFSWLLSRTCTKYAGTLSFLIHFACTTDGVEDYAWNTAIFQSITIGNGMNNGAEVIEPYADIIAQWKADLFGVGDTQEQRLLTVSAEQQATIAAKGAAVLDSIPDEYEALQAQADENTRIKAGAIVLDAEGESIVVNDASDFPMMGLKVFGKSTQDGSPTPDAPVEIVSVENPVVTVYGKNLLKNTLESKTHLGCDIVVNNDGSVVINGTATSEGTIVFNNHLVLPIGTYELSGERAVAFLRDKDNKHKQTFFTGKTITIEDPTDYLLVGVYANNGQVFENLKTYPMLRLATETDDSFELYKETQAVETVNALHGIPVSSGGNYTDADGQQWICDEVDLKRGVYVQRVAHIVVDETSDVRMNVATDGKTNGYPYRYFLNLNNIMVNPESIMCDRLAYKNVNALVGSSPENEGITVSPVYSCIYLNLNQHMTEDTVDECKAALANYPLTVNHVLATPIETALSDAEINSFKALYSNKPTTTILNDAGAFMAVEYVADTKTYIDKKIKELMEGSE